MQFPKKIPTLLGLVSLVLVIAAVIFVSETFLKSGATAGNNLSPQKMIITNVTDETFTLTWQTTDQATGSVIATPVKGKKLTGFDDRDINGQLGSYKTHSVTIRGATADTAYNLSLISQGKTYSAIAAVTTGPRLNETSSALEPAYGQVVTNSGTPAAGALVYLTLSGGQTLSTLTKSSGSWLIPLSTVRLTDLSAVLPPGDRLDEEISAYHEGDQAFATSDTLNDSPLPEMTIGQTYDFKRLQGKVKTPPQLTATNANQSAQVLGNQTETGKPFTVDIIAPAKNAAVPSFYPDVYGHGIPGKSVTITVGIARPESGITQVEPSGIWRYKLQNPVGIGRQSITIATVDAYSKPVALTHLFEILKSGTQVLGEATPSATLAPEPTIEPTPEPTPEPVETAAPMPVSGNETPAIILTIFGLLLLGSGIMVAIR